MTRNTRATRDLVELTKVLTLEGYRFHFTGGMNQRLYISDTSDTDLIVTHQNMLSITPEYITEYLLRSSFSYAVEQKSKYDAHSDIACCLFVIEVMGFYGSKIDLIFTEEKQYNIHAKVNDVLRQTNISTPSGAESVYRLLYRRIYALVLESEVQK